MTHCNGNGMNGVAMSVLVTGGAGYVGSHTVVLLLEKGLDVIVVDDCSNAVLTSGADKPECLLRIEELTGKTISFYNIDIADKNALRGVFKQHNISVVLHFAALKAVGESVEKPLEYYTVNIGGTVALLHVMREFEVFSIIYSSTCTVYGIPQYLPIDEAHSTGIGCTNPYAKSKVFTEEIMKDVACTDKRWRVVMLRYFNPVGAHPSGRIGEDPKGIPNNLLPYISQVAIGKLKVLSVFGNDYNTVDGTGVRDYLHIMDCAEGHVKALDYIDQGLFSGYKAFNLGSGRSSSVLEAIKAFESATNQTIPYRVVGRRLGDLDEIWASCHISSNELNWKAKYTLQDACRDMWKWQTDNPNGYTVIQK